MSKDGERNLPIDLQSAINSSEISFVLCRYLVGRPFPFGLIGLDHLLSKNLYQLSESFDFAFFNQSAIIWPIHACNFLGC
jgi:hypothetical protein